VYFGIVVAFAVLRFSVAIILYQLNGYTYKLRCLLMLVYTMLYETIYTRQSRMWVKAVPLGD
jgi:hypothetical protein